jgi:hypothetical protein
MSLLSICSVSVDVDTLRCYHAIHGLAAPREERADPIYTHALPRILKIFREYGLRGTFFCIGQDAKIPAHQAMLAQIRAEGHEIANHTHRHPYHLTTLSAEAMEEEIALAEEALAPFLPQGERIVGFRSPGYNTHPALLSILRRRGYLYDSSVFPCAPYYLAKAAVMGMMWLRQRPSRSLLGSPRVLLAPHQPYQPQENPFLPARSLAPDALWQIPIPPLPGLSLPFIGTSILLYPPLLLHLALHTVCAQPFVNLELHAIDFFDAFNDPYAEALIPYQPDLRLSITKKLARFRQTFSALQKQHAFLPLAEVLPFLSTQAFAGIAA